jgi:hypothetical protein
MSQLVKPQNIIIRRPFNFRGQQYVVLAYHDAENPAQVGVAVYTETLGLALTKSASGIPVHRIHTVQAADVTGDNASQLDLLMDDAEADFKANPYP